MIDPATPDFTATPVANRPAFPYALADPAPQPSLTIMTPFFNTGSVFQETVTSVLRQSLQHWEWLIINDGSDNPDALALLAPLRSSDPRIRVVDHPQNQGLSAARNTGFRAASTPFVLQLDSDDLLEPTAAEIWLWYLLTHPAAAFVKGYTVGFGAQQYLHTGGFQAAEEFLDRNHVEPTALVRHTVWQAVGGYDETLRDGLEDWEFWLRCANAGYWGATIPLYQSWYRRREHHGDRWGTWDGGAREAAFRAELRRRYPRLWQGGFPHLAPPADVPATTLPAPIGLINPLRSGQNRVLLLLPWLEVGGADTFNLNLVAQLVQRGYAVTIVTTVPAEQRWLPRFAALTPEIFVLDRFLPAAQWPNFLSNLIASRQIDTLLLANSALGYGLLPFLRQAHPDLAVLDYLHMEEDWEDGGYPGMSARSGALLDLTVVSSEHLRRWMLLRGGVPERLVACHTSIDTVGLAPDPALRAATRAELGIADDTPLLLYTARLHRQKRPELLAAILQDLAASGARFVCLLAGDGPERAATARALRAVPQAWLLGAQPPERVRALLAAADLFLLPSANEGISLAIYEALACGVPVVAAAVGGQPELVTPVCGDLILPGPNERANYVAAVAALLHDPARRTALGAAGRKRVVDHFGLEQMGARMDQLIQQAHQQRRSLALDSASVQRLTLAALEQARQQRALAQLQQEQTGLFDGGGSPGQRALYRAKLALRPAYRWALRRGAHWLIPLRNQVYLALGRRKP